MGTPRTAMDESGAPVPADPRPSGRSCDRRLAQPGSASDRVPRRRRLRGASIQDLVSRIPNDYEAAEVDWGEPAGKETW